MEQKGAILRRCCRGHAPHPGGIAARRRKAAKMREAGLSDRTSTKPPSPLQSRSKTYSPWMTHGTTSAVDGQAARLVTLRFFAGLNMTEAAEALGMSVRNIGAGRLWAYVRVSRSGTNCDRPRRTAQ